MSRDSFTCVGYASECLVDARYIDEEVIQREAVACCAKQMIAAVKQVD